MYSLNSYKCLEMDKEEKKCAELSEKTLDVLDDDVLVNLFVSTQTNNLDLCIKKAIKLVSLFLIFTFKYSPLTSTGVSGNMVAIYLLLLKGH